MSVLTYSTQFTQFTYIIVYPASSLAEEEHNLQTSHVNQPDGIITVPMLDGGNGNEKIYRLPNQRGIPVVQLLSRSWNDLPMIGRNSRKIGFEAVRVLYEKGHRRIEVIPDGVSSWLWKLEK